jgi:hypothetical protein
LATSILEKSLPVPCGKIEGFKLFGNVSVGFLLPAQAWMKNVI